MTRRNSALCRKLFILKVTKARKLQLLIPLCLKWCPHFRHLLKSYNREWRRASPLYLKKYRNYLVLNFSSLNNSIVWHICMYVSVIIHIVLIIFKPIQTFTEQILDFCIKVHYLCARWNVQCDEKFMQRATFLWFHM